MSWHTDTMMLSPVQERQFWIDTLSRYPFGMAVNCRHMPSLDRTPILRKLIEEGKVVRTREKRGKNSARTILRLPD